LASFETKRQGEIIFLVFMIHLLGKRNCSCCGLPWREKGACKMKAKEGERERQTDRQMD
jgi:hypothetical protein